MSPFILKILLRPVRIQSLNFKQSGPPCSPEWGNSDKNLSFFNLFSWVFRLQFSIEKSVISNHSVTRYLTHISRLFRQIRKRKVCILSLELRKSIYPTLAASDSNWNSRVWKRFKAHLFSSNSQRQFRREVNTQKAIKIECHRQNCRRIDMSVLILAVR